MPLRPAALSILATVFCLNAAPAPGRADEKDDPRGAAKKDLESLQGTWVETKRQQRGHDPAVDPARNSVYKGDALYLRNGNEVRRRCIVTLDPNRNPKAMNVWDLEGPFEDQVVPGIYEIDGDTLKLCFAAPGETRPTAFSTKEGTGFMLLEMKRKK